MIELPAGGLKFKIGQRGSLNGHAVYFAPDGRSWDWFFVTSFEPDADRFQELVNISKELGDKIIAMHSQMMSTTGIVGGAFAVKVPKSRVADIKL